MGIGLVLWDFLYKCLIVEVVDLLELPRIRSNFESEELL